MTEKDETIVKPVDVGGIGSDTFLVRDTAISDQIPVK
jgi:hypothetical protein